MTDQLDSLQAHIIHGSNLYGTNTPTSDRDYKGIYIPDPKDILLGRVKPAYHLDTKKDRVKPGLATSPKNNTDDMDFEVWSLAQFFKLLEDGDPIVLDTLFAPNYAILKTSHMWSEIQNNTAKLISKEIGRSIHYCHSQLAKYGVKGSRMYECEVLWNFFKDVIEHESPRNKVKEYDNEIRAKIEGFVKTSIVNITQADRSELPHIECVGKKISYNVSVQEAFNILNVMYTNFGERTKLAKNNQGIDWKAVSHAYRVGNQMLELLATGRITFPRPEAPLLLDIKCGKLSFEAASQLVDENFAKMDQAILESKLPDKVDREWMDDFILNYYGCAVLEMQL